jgi:hypothetical protein
VVAPSSRNLAQHYLVHRRLALHEQLQEKWSRCLAAPLCQSVAKEVGQDPCSPLGCNFCPSQPRASIPSLGCRTTLRLRAPPFPQALVFWVQVEMFFYHIDSLHPPLASSSTKKVELNWVVDSFQRPTRLAVGAHIAERALPGMAPGLLGLLVFVDHLRSPLSSRLRCRIQVQNRNGAGQPRSSLASFSP